MVKSKRFRKNNKPSSNNYKPKPSVKNKNYRKPTHVKRIQNESNKPFDQSIKNPFEVRVNKIKHDVVGRATRNEVGRPGVSRAKAQEKRKATLLEEYKHRNKSSMLIDSRIGEKNKHMPEEDKLIRRAAVEKTRQYKKKSIFSLRDDDEVLTHKGKSLTKIDRYEDPREQSDSEDELLSGAFVSDANFSGFMRMKTSQDLEEDEGGEHNGSKMSRDEIIKELILASKKRKFEKAKESDENYEKIQDLDNEFKSPEFQALLNQLQAPKNATKSSGLTVEAGSSIEELLGKIRSGYDVASESSNQNKVVESLPSVKGDVKRANTASDPNDELDYDRLVRELQFEAKNARPTDLAKTKVQQVENDREMLQNLLKESTTLSASLKAQILKALDPVFQSKGEDKTKLPDILSSLIGFILEQVDYGQTQHQQKASSTKLSVLSPTFKIFSSIMLPHLHSLLVANSVGCTKRFLEHLIQVRDEFLKNNHQQISAQLTALLQICPKLFLSADCHHWVLNPAADFLLFAIHNANFKAIQGAFRILNLTCILYDIVERSKRYCPEAISFLWSILLCFCPETPDNINRMIPNIRKARRCFVSFGDDNDIKSDTKHVGEDLTDDLGADTDDNKSVKILNNVQEQFLSLTLKVLEKYISMYEYLPSSVEIFKPIQLTLMEILKVKDLSTGIVTKINSLVELISSLKGEKQFLRIAAAKPKPLRLYEPQIDEDFDGTRKKRLPRKLQEEARLSHKVKQEFKSAVREIKKDNLFLAREQLKDQIRMDTDRKRKVKELMGSLANQEGDYQKMKRLK